MGKIIVWGAGELGGRVVARSCGAGYATHALTATTDRHRHLSTLGATVGTGDPGNWQSDDALLLCIAGTDALRTAIERLENRSPPHRVVLTSSTGYYNGRGGFIGHDTGAGPSARAQNIAACEQLFKEWAGDAGVILRLGGLYRQGRGPLNALKARGHAPYGPGNTTLALIHYDDAASAAWKALTIPHPQSEYVVVSSPCPKRHDFYMAACVVLELDLPNFAPPSPNSPAEYDVSALRRDLLPEPKHPKWQAALVP